jgi:hypothetical protein
VYFNKASQKINFKGEPVSLKPMQIFNSSILSDETKKIGLHDFQQVITPGQ